jgi:hypothetical protein
MKSRVCNRENRSKMSATTSPPNLQRPRGTSTFRQIVIGALFAVVLLVPKILHVRRNTKSWMLFRILLGIAGAALVVFPVGLGNGYAISLAGLAMFVLAILLPSAKPGIKADDKARELGALVVVNGGRFKLADGPSFAVQIFVGPEQVWVLDSLFQSFLEIPVVEITSARAEESHGRWFLRVDWANKNAAFAYRGVFAEHLALVAESTIHSVMRPALPVLPQRRAASA